MKFASQCISSQIMDPLTTINQYVDILLRKLEQRPEIMKLLEAIKCCNQMIKFNILDLQDIANIQKRNFKIKKESLNPRELLEEVINSNKMQAHKKKQRIVLKIDENVPKMIESDPIRLQQVVNNLLTNAIKFSDEKTRINIESYYMAEKRLFQVTVIDEGIPISEEEAATLFKPYATLKSARDINAAGPGLGLYMCRELCRKMGGEIKLVNKVKKSIGEKAFVLNVKASIARVSTDSPDPIGVD